MQHMMFGSNDKSNESTPTPEEGFSYLSPDGNTLTGGLSSEQAQKLFADNGFKGKIVPPKDTYARFAVTPSKEPAEKGFTLPTWKAGQRLRYTDDGGVDKVVVFRAWNGNLALVEMDRAVHAIRRKHLSPLFDRTVGTTVSEVDHDTFKTKREAWEDLPTLTTPKVEVITRPDWHEGQKLLLDEGNRRPTDVVFRGWNGSLAQVELGGRMYDVKREHLTVPTTVEVITPEVITPKRTVKAATISDVAKERIERHQRLLRDIGIATPPPIYAAGTTVLDVGYGNLQAKREAWDALPTLRDAAGQVSGLIAREKRKDFTIELQQLSMDPEGRVRFEGGEMPFEKGALGQLLSLPKLDEQFLSEQYTRLSDNGGAFPRGFALMMALPPDLRADVFNRQIARSRNRKVVMRTREHSGTRSAFAIVSETYHPFDADRVLNTLSAAVTGPYRAEVIYNPVTTGLEVAATMHAPSDVQDFAAGDVFQVGYKFKSNDNGTGSFNGGTVAFRNLCLNLIIIGQGRGSKFRIIHKGGMNSAVAEVRKQTRRGHGVFNQFAKDWNLLRETDISNVQLWGKDFTSIDKALTWGVTHGKIKAGVAKDVLAKALVEGFAREPGETLADLVNAVTRAAHHTDKWDTLVRDELEELAGRVLVPVLVQAARK